MTLNQKVINVYIRFANKTSKNHLKKQLTKQFTYTCECCGKQHTDWPALAFISPVYYSQLSEDKRNETAELNEDFCVIKGQAQTDRFIRCTLFQTVNDHCQDLNYGLWVSLSEKSFNEYSDNFGNAEYEATHFGWLSNNIPEYHFDKSIPTTIIKEKGNSRPYIVPHENFDHLFVKDYYNGITKTEAEKRIQSMLANSQTEKFESESKPWWKFW